MNSGNGAMLLLSLAGGHALERASSVDHSRELTGSRKSDPILPIARAHVGRRWAVRADSGVRYEMMVRHSALWPAASLSQPASAESSPGAIPENAMRSPFS